MKCFKKMQNANLYELLMYYMNLKISLWILGIKRLLHFCFLTSVKLLSHIHIYWEPYLSSQDYCISSLLWSKKRMFWLSFLSLVFLKAIYLLLLKYSLISCLHHLWCRCFKSVPLAYIFLQDCLLLGYH